MKQEFIDTALPIFFYVGVTYLIGFLFQNLVGDCSLQTPQACFR